MAQHDYVIANGTGAAVRSDLNNALAAIVSQNSGATEPATMYAYQWWADTSTGLLKLRNAANNAWITLRELDGTLTIEAGTVSAPGLAFASDLNTGVWSPGADQFAIATNGVERVEWGTSEVVFNDGGADYGFRIEGDTNSSLFFVDASTDRVGIGTTSPFATLTVGSGSGNQEIAILAGNTSESNLVFADATTGAGSYTGKIVYSHNEERMSFIVGSGVERARIDSSGRLLVGTSTARSSDGVTPRYFQEGANTYEALGICSNGGTDPGRAGFILMSRSRGTTAGSSTIVANGDCLGGLNFYGADGTDIETAAAAIRAEVDGTPGANDMPGRLTFFTTSDGAAFPTERMRITNDGKLLLGTTDAAAISLAYFRTGVNGDTVHFWNDGASFTGNTLLLSASRNTTTSTYNFLTCVRQGAAVALYIRDSGNVQNANNSYGAISDIKLKENIVDASSQWDDIKSLQVRKYNFKEETGQSTHTQIGLIAQEAELVSPGLVTESPDRDAEGNDLGTITKSVNYSVLYMKAVKALQEAMERIETLEAKVAALEGA